MNAPLPDPEELVRLLAEQMRGKLSPDAGLVGIYTGGAWVAERVLGGAIRVGGERGERLLTLAGNTVRGVVYGILGTAIVQGVIAGIGFLIALLVTGRRRSDQKYAGLRILR